MRPKLGSAVYRPDLGTLMVEYMEQGNMGFIGLEIMPIFRSPVQSGTYPVIPKEVMLTAPDASRAPRSSYQRDDWEYERGIFQTHEKGVEEVMDDSERALLDQEAPGSADLVSTERAYRKIMRSQELRIANKIFNETNFTANALTNEWDDFANATPIDDVNDGILSFREACGMLPDALVIAFSTFLNLKSCDQIVNRLVYNFPGADINRMNPEQLAAVLNVPRVLVGGGIYNAAGKGLDASLANIWSNEYAALVKISNGRDLSIPGVGRTFLWTEDSPQNPIVESYREEQTRSDIFRVRHHVDESLCQSKTDTGAVQSNVAAACVYLFSNVTT